jgi:hypothetical protein
MTEIVEDLGDGAAFVALPDVVGDLTAVYLGAFGGEALRHA